jgi:hypothetical protein
MIVLFVLGTMSVIWMLVSRRADPTRAGGSNEG